MIITIQLVYFYMYEYIIYKIQKYNSIYKYSYLLLKQKCVNVEFIVQYLFLNYFFHV